MLNILLLGIVVHVSRHGKGKQPHVLQEAMQGVEAYTQNILQRVKEQVEFMEVKVKTQHREQHKFSIDDETLCCILEIRSIHAQVTKYGKILDLYWKEKFMSPRVLGENKFESMKIHRQMARIQTQLQLMEHKQDTLAR